MAFLCSRWFYPFLAFLIAVRIYIYIVCPCKAWLLVQTYSILLMQFIQSWKCCNFKCHQIETCIDWSYIIVIILFHYVRSSRWLSRLLISIIDVLYFVYVWSKHHTWILYISDLTSFIFFRYIELSFIVVSELL